MQEWFIKNKGGGNFCSSGASEGGAEAIGANPNLTFDAWFVATFLLAEEMVTKRRVGEGEHVRGQGEDDTPEGWTFLNF